MSERRPTSASRLPGLARCVLLLALVVTALPVRSETQERQRELAALREERQALTTELDQYDKTLAILQVDGVPAVESSNPAVRRLAAEELRIQQRLLALTEREVTLVQEQITTARDSAVKPVTSSAPSSAATGMESRPLTLPSSGHSLAREAENVARLYGLLESYYSDLQESMQTLPGPEEIARREAAIADAQRLASIPFSAGKIRLNGPEGSTALAQISKRLADPNIPESRRDVAPICSVRTRLFGNLIAGDRLSLTPVGKNHYVARIRFQPGDTTLRVKDMRWELRLPDDINASDYLVTLYAPPGANAELHVVAVEDLLGAEEAYLPAWLPADLRLNPAAG